MEKQKTINLLNDSDNKSSKFATKKWHVIHDKKGKEYGEGNINGKSVKFEIGSIESNLCDYLDI